MLNAFPRSIRSTLLLIVCAAMTPALLILFFNGKHEELREAARARTTAMLQVLHLCEQEEDFANASHQLLSALAALPAIQNLDPTTNNLLSKLLARNPQYANLLLTDKEGLVIGSALPISGRISLADRKHFQDAVRTKAFSTGEFIISRTAHRRVFPFSLPILDQDQEVKGVLIAVQGLENSDSLFPRMGLPEGTDLVMVDHKGVLLHHIDSPNVEPGKTLSPEALAPLLNNAGRGTYRALDSQGLPRLYAFQALHLNDHKTPYMVLRIGVPEQIALAESRQAMRRNMLATGLALLGAMTLAWFLGGLLVQRPVRQLLLATSRFEQGDWTAASNLPHGKNELGQLAAALNDLGAALQTRESALRSREQTLRMLFDSVNDAIFVHDAHTGAILAVNQRVCEMYGCTREEIYASDIAAYSAGDPPFSQREALTWIRKAAAGQPQLFEWKARNRAGNIFWVEVNMRRARIDDEDRILVVVRDIQERKEAEQQHRKLENQVHQAQKLESLGVLAGGIAHDFNNLLTAILGNLSLAKEVAMENTERIYLDKAERAAHRAAELTKQMLAYAGRGHTDSKPLNMNLLVQEMSNLLRISIPKKISLDLQLASNLPLFDGDKAQIQQILLNLLTNASEAVGDVKGAITITTTRWELNEDTIVSTLPGQPIEPGVYVMLEVHDTGCGMSKEVEAKIFEPFFSTKANGRGLGLSAMQGILKSHHGGIQILSQVGSGSAFRVFLPASQALTTEPEAELMDSGEPMVGHVLLVEDEASIRESTRTTLERHGLQVTEAEDGQAAVEAFQMQPDAFDIVLMDLTMPRMNGREAFQAIQNLRPGMPVILCSGYDEHSSTLNLIQEGLAAFIPKPYVMNDLTAAIRRCISPRT